MTSVGAWAIGLALGYTLFLIGAGCFIRRRAGGGDCYFVGGRNFRPITVAFCITGMFSGSSFIAIVELSYRTGISAIWYGVAESLQILLIALVLIVPFRKRCLVTISGMIGDRFGRGPLALSGVITAFTFPMRSVATAIAFASALHAFTGLSIQVSIIFTALLLLLYLLPGGMCSVAFTQTANCVVMFIMLVVGVVAVSIEPGWSQLLTVAQTRPELLDWTAVGMPLIVAWFGTFMLNMILAQATFQMALSCRTPEDGRTGLLLAVWMGVPFILLGVVLGVAAALVVPGHAHGLVAVPVYIVQVMPAPVAGLFVLGIWAAALGWGGPSQFSGATSLGRDVGKAVNPAATDVDLVRYTRWALVLLTALMIIFGSLRTSQAAWWNVLSWTLRNGATMAPVLAALFWPLATRRSVYASLSLGFLSGLGWYHLGGWLPDAFLFGIHPVWVGMSINVSTMVVVTLVETLGTWRVGSEDRTRQRWGLTTLAGTGVVALGAVTAWDWLQTNGLLGLAILSAILLAAISTFLLVQQRPEPTVPPVDPDLDLDRELELATLASV